MLSKSETNLSIAASIAWFLTKSSITFGATVDAPIPQLHNSNTCWEFLKLAAKTSVLKLFRYITFKFVNSDLI